MTMKDSWNRFEAWLEKHVPDSSNLLGGPATAAQIKELEQKIGVSLTQDFIDFYSIHNGQDDDSVVLFDCQEFLSIERIIDEWSVWKDLLDGGDFADSKSESPAEVRDDWWHAHWIPFTYDGGGNHYCVDLAPTEHGKRGQIIEMWHDDSTRPVLANSLADWFESYVTRVEKGEVVYSEEYGGLVDAKDVD